MTGIFLDQASLWPLEGKGHFGVCGLFGYNTESYQTTVATSLRGERRSCAAHRAAGRPGQEFGRRCNPVRPSLRRSHQPNSFASRGGLRCRKLLQDHQPGISSVTSIAWPGTAMPSLGRRGPHRYFRPRCRNPLGSRYASTAYPPGLMTHTFRDRLRERFAQILTTRRVESHGKTHCRSEQPLAFKTVFIRS